MEEYKKTLEKKFSIKIKDMFAFKVAYDYVLRDWESKVYNLLVNRKDSNSTHLIEERDKAVMAIYRYNLAYRENMRKG
jgi:hypothetical protein